MCRPVMIWGLFGWADPREHPTKATCPPIESAFKVDGLDGAPTCSFIGEAWVEEFGAEE